MSKSPFTRHQISKSRWIQRVRLWGVWETNEDKMWRDVCKETNQVLRFVEWLMVSHSKTRNSNTNLSVVPCVPERSLVRVTLVKYKELQTCKIVYNRRFLTETPSLQMLWQHIAREIFRANALALYTHTHTYIHAHTHTFTGLIRYFVPKIELMVVNLLVPNYQDKFVWDKYSNPARKTNYFIVSGLQNARELKNISVIFSTYPQLDRNTVPPDECLSNYSHQCTSYNIRRKCTLNDSASTHP